MGRKGAVLVFVFLAWTAAGQEECMDCLERQSTRKRTDGSTYTFYEALCCDAPCVGGWEVVETDVGWGCLTKAVDWPDAAGTTCISSDRDDGCPTDDEGPGDLDPALDDPGSDPDDGRGSPIVLPLGDDIYRLTSISNGVQFDLRDDGHRIRMGWTRLGTDNAFLALDRNGNGRIDSGAELFGNYTRLASGEQATNGFEALAELDADSNGTVDASDAAWQRLLLWTDRNHDGMSTADELQPIAGSTVAGLETDHRRVGRKDQWGNEFRYMAHYRLAGGARATYYDIFFRTAE
jgi:hypothetical protein